MRNAVLLRTAVTIVLCLSAAIRIASTSATLSNESVLDMVKAGMSDEVIVKAIQQSDAKFDTSAVALVQLRKAGVSNAVIASILDKVAEPSSRPTIAASDSASVLPANYGVYAVKAGELVRMRSQPIVALTGLRLSGKAREGIALDGLRGSPLAEIASLDYIIVYEPGINIRDWTISELEFVESIRAGELNILNTPAHLFESFYGVPQTRTIEVNLWRRGRSSSLDMSPIADRPDMYKLTPHRGLTNGRYALHESAALRRSDSAFAHADGSALGKAYYFAIHGTETGVRRATAAPESCKLGEATVKVNHAALKQKPDFRAETKQLLPAGARVTVLAGPDNGYCQVEVAATRGWMNPISLKYGE